MSGHLLDLSSADVHVPSAGKPKMAQAQPAPPFAKKGKKPAKKKLVQPPARGQRRVSVRADIAPGGSMHVRHHLSARGVGFAITLGEEVDPGDVGVTLKAATPGKLVWIQLAELGAFKGHPAGPFELSERVFDEIVTNFKADGLPVPIDAEHASEMEASSGSIPAIGAPAFGWIHQMENRGRAGLWGLVEWCALAREYISDGRYRYLSPAVRFGSRDRVTGMKTGAKLTSAALTNQPFLKGMASLTASERDTAAAAGALLNDVIVDGPAFSAKEILPPLRVALRLPELATPTELEAQLDRVRELYISAREESDVEPVVAETMRALRDVACSGRYDATWCEVFETVQDMIDASIGRHVVEYHGEETDEDEDDVTGGEMAPSALTTDKEITMSDAAKKNPTDQPSDVVTLTTKITEQSLTLREKEARISELETENARLLKFKTDAEEASIGAEVEDAIATHGEKKGITLSDKPALIDFRKASPESFARMYPPVDPSKRHLLRNIAPTEDRKKVPVASTLDAPSEKVTLASLTKRLMRESKMSFSDAQNRAFTMLRESAAQEG